MTSDETPILCGTAVDLRRWASVEERYSELRGLPDMGLIMSLRKAADELDRLTSELKAARDCLETDGGECYGWKMARAEVERLKAVAEAAKALGDLSHLYEYEGDESKCEWRRLANALAALESP